MDLVLLKSRISEGGIKMDNDTTRKDFCVVRPKGRDIEDDSYRENPVEILQIDEVHPRVAFNYKSICDAAVDVPSDIIDGNDSESCEKYMKLLDFRTAKDSRFFRELWEEKLRGNTNYVTAYDELVQGDSPYIPLWVNCIGKHLTGSRLFLEYLCPRILNLFNQKTVYNAIVDDSSIVSVDCISKGHSLYGLGDFYPEMEENSDGNGISLKLITKVFKDHDSFVKRLREVSGKDIKISDEDLKKLENEVVMQYLMRVCLLRDSDFQPWNIGLMVSDDGKLENAPQFDFGYCMHKSGVDNFTVMKRLKVAARDYPEVYDKFISLVKENFENGKLEEVIDSAEEKFEETNSKKDGLIYGEPAKDILLDSVKEIYAMSSEIDFLRGAHTL